MKFTITTLLLTAITAVFAVPTFSTTEKVFNLTAVAKTGTASISDRSPVYFGDTIFSLAPGDSIPVGQKLFMATLTSNNSVLTIGSTRKEMNAYIPTKYDQWYTIGFGPGEPFPLYGATKEWKISGDESNLVLLPKLKNGDEAIGSWWKCSEGGNLWFGNGVKRSAGICTEGDEVDLVVGWDLTG